MIHAVLAIQIWARTYSVLDIGKPRVPSLTARQTQWLRLIHCAPAYAKRWKELRFTVDPIANTVLDGKPTEPRQVQLRVPLVVFDPNGWTPSFGNGTFYIIGAPCRAYFDPVTDTLSAPVNEVCLGKDRPPSIAGAERFLRHLPLKGDAARCVYSHAGP